MKKLPAAALAFALLAPAAPAHADTEYWGWWETRVPLTKQLQWRTLGDVRYGSRYPGLGLSFFRTGPLCFVTPDFFIGAHFTTIALQNQPSGFQQEYRAELEPNVLGRLGDFAWAERFRLEHRWRGADAHFRVRNQLRLAYAPVGATWMPYVWDEPLVELNANGLNQNRLEVGLAYQPTPDLRIDVGPMWRLRKDAAGAWDSDLVINTNMVFTPKINPIFSPSSNSTLTEN